MPITLGSARGLAGQLPIPLPDIAALTRAAVSLVTGSTGIFCQLGGRVTAPGQPLAQATCRAVLFIVSLSKPFNLKNRNFHSPYIAQTDSFVDLSCGFVWNVVPWPSVSRATRPWAGGGAQGQHVQPPRKGKHLHREPTSFREASPPTPAFRDS